MVVQTGWLLDHFFSNVCNNEQESREWGGDPEFCMPEFRDYDAAQDF